MTKYTMLTALCMCVSLGLSYHMDATEASTFKLILWIAAHIAVLVFITLAQNKEDKLENRIKALEDKLSAKEDE